MRLALLTLLLLGCAAEEVYTCDGTPDEWASFGLGGWPVDAIACDATGCEEVEAVQVLGTDDADGVYVLCGDADTMHLYR